MGQEVRGGSTSHFEMKHCQCKLGQDRCRNDRSGSRGEAERTQGEAPEMCGAASTGCLLAPAAWTSRTIPSGSSPGPRGPTFPSVLQATSQPSSGLTVAIVRFCGLSQKGKKEYVRMDAAHDILERQLKTSCGANGIFSCSLS